MVRVVPSTAPRVGKRASDGGGGPATTYPSGLGAGSVTRSITVRSDPNRIGTTVRGAVVPGGSVGPIVPSTTLESGRSRYRRPVLTDAVRHARADSVRPVPTGSVRHVPVDSEPSPPVSRPFSPRPRRSIEAYGHDRPRGHDPAPAGRRCRSPLELLGAVGRRDCCDLWPLRYGRQRLPPCSTRPRYGSTSGTSCRSEGRSEARAEYNSFSRGWVP